MRFSRSKFLQLSTESRNNKILQFINEIEENWEEKHLKEELIANLREFLSFYNKKEFTQKAIKLFPEMNRREFLQVVVPLEQIFAAERSDDQIIVTKLDGQRPQRTELPLVLILDNLRSAFNVGSIMRSAECFGVKTICLCGYTPNNHKVTKTSMGTRNLLEIKVFTETQEAIVQFRKNQYRIYAMETSTKSTNIFLADLVLPAVLVLGNEALGISEQILKMVDEVLEIPLSGWKNSLNVAAAASIGISEFYRNSIVTRSS